MHINLAYGSGHIPVDVPDNWINGRCYRPQSMEPLGDVRAALDTALADLPQGHTIADLGREHDCALVAVDSTAPVLMEEVLPALVDALKTEAGIPHNQVTLLFSNPPWGLPLPAAEVAERLPANLRAACEVIVHDPTGPEQNAEPANPQGKLPLRINKAYIGAPLRIVLGGVRPDMLLGFTGGRAVILPGLTGEQTHSALLTFNNIGNRNARAGNFRDNPFHLAGMEAIHTAGCELLVSAVLNPEDEIHAINAGHVLQSHLAAMKIAREAMVVKVKEPMDIVVTSGGGAPRDGTLYDLVQTLGMVLPVLKKEGTIVAACAMEQGFGPPEFDEIIRRNGSIHNSLRRIALATHRGPAQWVAQKLFSILQEHEVILYNTETDEDALWKAGLTPSRDINEAILGAMESHGQRCKIVALPDGPLGLGEIASRR